MTPFVNRTRRSPSIPARLLRERRLLLLPFYYLVRTSYLGREGIEHSGSARFADHIYRGRPRGRFGIGVLLDAILLHLPPARAFRARYRFARGELERLLAQRAHGSERLDLLAVPCGLARELFDVARREGPGRRAAFPEVALYGIDLDPVLIAELQARPGVDGVSFTFAVGDALDPESYDRTYDAVVSLGFGEFLDDARLREFYRLVRGRLKPGGRFITSGFRRLPLTDFLLQQIAELHTHYRDADDLRDLASEAGFSKILTYHDRTGLLTMLIAGEG